MRENAEMRSILRSQYGEKDSFEFNDHVSILFCRTITKIT